MHRRDTEKYHNYSHEIFQALKIFDIQGLLKEGNTYKCGVEAYQVKSFNEVRFQVLNQNVEYARYSFCQCLSIPYYIIITSEKSGHYQIYNTQCTDTQVTFHLLHTYTKQQFLGWWQEQQSFTQKKAMYNARARIRHSIMDDDLFSNNLAWGVNIDGFMLGEKTNNIIALFEKRVCTYKPPQYTVHNYDPNRFFHGTAQRSGDFPAWKILFTLAQHIDVALLLLTFETSINKVLGASKIINISKQHGIRYKNDVLPHHNIFHDDLSLLKSWLRANI